MVRSVAVLTLDPWCNRLHGSSIIDMFLHLANLGYTVTIIMPFETDGLLITECKSGKGLRIIKVKIKNIPIVSYVILMYRFLNYLDYVKPDVVILDLFLLPMYLVYSTLRREHVTTIILILSRPVMTKGLRGILINLFFRVYLILSKLVADAITAISPFEAFEFSRLGKLQKSKLIVLPSPLGKVFVEQERDIDVDKLSFTLKHVLYDPNMNLSNKVVLLYHGALDEERGVLKLVEAFVSEFGNNDDFLLLLVGYGNARTKIEEYIRMLKIKNIIVIPPIPYSEVPSLISLCSVGLLPLPPHEWWQYQTPTKLLEFISLGKPVIASNLAGIRWISKLVSPFPVILVNEWNGRTLRGSIEKLIRMQLQDQLKLQARQRIVEYFSSKSLAYRLKRLIENLMESKNL
ncbi:MAG: glycosyltransferase [Infirmifilum sp.]